jgi:membrane protein YqaA with SNARE-associated domain
MPVFSALYDKTMTWSRHPKAPWALAGVSFAESSFFLIPPDVMLMPMSLAQPHRALFFATLTTLMSVLGGILGYFIGLWALDWVLPLLEGRYAAYYQQARDWFTGWGFWAVLIAGFSPVPYKVFTIAAGAMHMAFLPFVLASCIGRGARFYLVALLMAWGGAGLEHKLRQWIDWIGWLLVAIIVLWLIIRYFLSNL